ncbi:MAG: hypothetical protein ACM3TR_10970 [Caulobacteraceae bacterium]
MQSDKVKVNMVSCNDQKQHKIKAIFPTGISTHHKGVLVALPEEGDSTVKIYILGCSGSEYRKAIEAMLSQIKELGEVRF